MSRFGFCLAPGEGAVVCFSVGSFEAKLGCDLCVWFGVSAVSIFCTSLDEHSVEDLGDLFAGNTPCVYIDSVPDRQVDRDLRRENRGPSSTATYSPDPRPSTRSYSGMVPFALPPGTSREPGLCHLPVVETRFRPDLGQDRVASVARLSWIPQDAQFGVGTVELSPRFPTRRYTIRIGGALDVRALLVSRVALGRGSGKVPLVGRGEPRQLPMRSLGLALGTRTACSPSRRTCGGLLEGTLFLPDSSSWLTVDGVYPGWMHAWLPR